MNRDKLLDLVKEAIQMTIRGDFVADGRISPSLVEKYVTDFYNEQVTDKAVVEVFVDRTGEWVAADPELTDAVQDVPRAPG